MICLMDTKAAQIGSNIDFKCQKYHMLFRGHLCTAYSGMNSILEEEKLNTWICQSFNYKRYQPLRVLKSQLLIIVYDS